MASTRSGTSTQRNSWVRRLLSLMALQKIAQSSQVDDRGIARIELLAQAVNVDLDRLRSDIVVDRADAVGERLLADRLAAARHQHFQYRVFARGQRQRPAAYGKGARIAVVAQVAAVQYRVLVLADSAQHRAHARLQFVDLERLDQVVVG